MKIPKCNRPACHPLYRGQGYGTQTIHEITCAQEGCLRKASDTNEQAVMLKWIELIKKPLPSESSRNDFDDGW